MNRPYIPEGEFDPKPAFLVALAITVLLVSVVLSLSGCANAHMGNDSHVEYNLVKIELQAEARAQIAGSSMQPNVDVRNRLSDSASQAHKLPFETEVSAPTQLDYQPPTPIFGSK